MTNKELITILQQWPSDCPVMIEIAYGIAGEISSDYINIAEDNICQAAGIIFLGSSE